MPSYNPELIQIMRAALDKAVSKIPVDQVTPAIKAQMAEFILKAAAEGQTATRICSTRHWRKFRQLSRCSRECAMLQVSEWLTRVRPQSSYRAAKPCAVRFNRS
jgi:hypothetical protein